MRGGYQVEVPQMPDSAHPKLTEWLTFLEKTIGNTDNETILIGHSIGATTVLRYVEKLPEKQKLGGIMVVACPLKPLDIEELRQLDHFFVKPFNFAYIQKKARKITAIYSKNDHRVPIDNSRILNDNLDTRYIEIPQGGHLNERSGFDKFPLLLDEAIRMTES